MHQKMYMYKRVVEAKLFIDHNYADNIDLGNIADSAHYSKFHFLRLFKDAFGKPPHKYLRDVRLHHAKEHLRSGKSVREVCFQVGFDSVTTFTNTFRKHIGKSPGVFQREEQNRKKEIAQDPFRFIPGCFTQSFGWKNSNSE